MPNKNNNNFSSFFLENIGFFLVLFLSNIFLISYEFYISSSGVVASSLFMSDFLKYLKNFFVVLGLSLIIVYITFIFKKYQKILIWFFVILNFIIFGIDYFLLTRFSAFINQFIIDSIFRTNLEESKEFFINYFSFGYVLKLFGAFVIYLMIFRISINKQIGMKINRFFVGFVLVLSLITFGDMVKKYFKTHLLSYTFVRFEGFGMTRMLCAFLYYKESAYVDYKKLLDGYKAMYESREKLKPSNDIKNIVLVLGESLNRNKMELYGGGYNTNPELSKLLKSGNLVLFSDTIAPYSSTNPVMQTLLNFSNYENTNKENPWYQHLDIISLFKLAGYKTHYISNQEGFGMWGNAAASIGHGADNVYFSNQYKNSIRFMNFKPDGVLLKYIDSLDLGGDKNFIVIHLMGSHFIYEYRYEDEFDMFKASDIESELDDKKRTNIAQYYNSILYNDYIVGSIYRKFANEDSIVLYISDHGESLYDDNTKTVLGHSITDKTNAEVPFIIMASDSFKLKHFDLFSAIKQATNRPYMSDDLIHTLCDIAGIYPKEYEPSRSVINDKFDFGRKRMFHGVDYDDRLKNNSNK